MVKVQCLFCVRLSKLLMATSTDDPDQGQMSGELCTNDHCVSPSLHDSGSHTTLSHDVRTVQLLMPEDASTGAAQ